MTVVALVGALIIGMSLGLLGSGGSILTVPVLVFILDRPEKLAIAESLAIVGCIAFMGAVPYAIRQQIHWKTVFFFGLPGMLGAYFGACGSDYVSSQLQLIVFACVMLIVAGMMFFSSYSFQIHLPSQQPLWMTAIEGYCIGCLTGFIGVGGGFLIIPALVLLSQLSMYLAIGTSLAIISLNSLTGFIKQFINLHALEMHVSWETIVLISITGVLGSFVGSFFVTKISQIQLKKAFSLSVLVISLYILFQKL